MPPKRRGTSRRSNVDRRISAYVHRLHLNSPPTWYLVKSRNTDPPPYNEDAIYQRKVRIAATLTVAGYPVVPDDVISSAGLTSTSFELFSINEIKVYSDAGVTVSGGAAPSIGIRLSTRIIQQVPKPTGTAITLIDREFSDYGVTGARRPCIHVRINPKDQGFIDSSQTDPTSPVLFVQTIGPGGIPVIGSVIIDMIVSFKNSEVTVRNRRLAQAKKIMERPVVDITDDLQVLNLVQSAKEKAEAHRALNPQHVIITDQANHSHGRPDGQSFDGVCNTCGVDFEDHPHAEDCPWRPVL